MKERLLLATTNKGKAKELAEIFGDLDLVVQTPDDVLRERPNVVEDGHTFGENALKKARALADLTGMLTLADDSGLEVDVLGGRPGVRSARFAHDRATDAENNAALLSALEELRGGDVGDSERFAARFRCALVVVDPLSRTQDPVVVEGTCEGFITRTPRGSAGFGYDPLFILEGTDTTMAEVDESEKNRVSHRAKAAASMKPKLRAILEERRAATLTLVAAGLLPE
ncbi:MAG: RdgB/HAM1 family non-canonical purine NTP pyrophosphatase [Polyangiaceae bacterium]